MHILREFLIRADRFEAQAKRLQTAAHKTTLWIDKVILFSTKAHEEREQAREYAQRNGFDFDAVLQEHISRKLNPEALSNRKVYERLRLLEKDTVYGDVPVAGGRAVQVGFPRKLIMRLLCEAGSRNQAICRFYVRNGEGYICPVTKTPPEKGKKQMMSKPGMLIAMCLVTLVTAVGFGQKNTITTVQTVPNGTIVNTTRIPDYERQERIKENVRAGVETGFALYEWHQQQEALRNRQANEMEGRYQEAYEELDALMAVVNIPEVAPVSTLPAGGMNWKNSHPSSDHRPE